MITYSLRNGEADLAAYYRDVTRFADDALAAGAPLLPVVGAFVSSVAERESESVRSEEEYLIELLVLGVYSGGSTATTSTTSRARPGASSPRSRRSAASTPF